MARAEPTRADAVRAAFRRQADACRRLGSPFTAQVIDLAAERLNARDAVGAEILNWPGDPGADALALRFAGALHALALERRSADLVACYPPVASDAASLGAAMDDAVAAHADRILHWMERPPQTNEPARASALILGLGAAARVARLPIALLEIGASAGLNLHLDRFHFSFGDAAYGPAGSQLRLAPEIRGAPPPSPPADLRIARRAACDRTPIDPADSASALRLRAFCWPDQPERLERLSAAIAIAAAAPERVVEADAGDWVPARLAARPEGMLTVVSHSIMWQYLPDETKARIEAALSREGAAATAERPLARLSLEPDERSGAALLAIDYWPGGARRRLARADYHGRWIEWTAQTPENGQGRA